MTAAEDAEFSDASIDAVFSATAFHWMDQQLICTNVARWLREGGVFFPFGFDAFTVKGDASSFYAREFEKWATHRDRRLVDCFDYERALRDSGMFGKVIPYAFSMRYEIPSPAAAGLISTFSYAREYARRVEDENYFQSVRDEFERYGKTVVFNVPISGALGVKS